MDSWLGWEWLWGPLDTGEGWARPLGSVGDGAQQGCELLAQGLDVIGCCEAFQGLNFPRKLNYFCCMFNKAAGGVYLCVNYYSYIIKGVSE